MSLSRKLLVLIFTWITALSMAKPIFVSSDNVNFTFKSFTIRNLTFLGDSHLRNGVVGLTRELGVPDTSSGTVIYNTPIRFYDPDSNTTASFSTHFSFSVQNLNPDPTSAGDGLAFFLSHDNDTLGSPGGYLGLVNSSQPMKNRFVAIEFDTKLDPHFNDPSGNHVGLDVDSLNSIATSDPSNSSQIDLKSGKSITSWIDYKNDLRLLNVFLSYTDPIATTKKPEKPLLSVKIDLSPFLNGEMYVGFSGSTEGSTEIHLIENWSFKTSGFLPVRSKSNHLHNVSDSSVVNDPVAIPSKKRRHRHNLAIGLGISFPVFFCLALLVFGYFTLKKWKSVKAEKELKTELITGLREFSYKELYTATKGFHSSRVIGRGAFGNVYRAMFVSSGTISAVKRSRHNSTEGKTEFLAELSIIACLRHKNLVQLQGWCNEKGELLLVYEFMPNGSLDKILYQESETGAVALDWSHRLNIAIGLASALSYLHHECEQQVVHRDIKTSNIMLDINFNARLGDFGLARLTEHDKSPVSTLTAGTMGYLAPEYLQYGTATEKTDAFSYGVVILEVACGRRPIDKEPESQKTVNLVDWVWRLHSEGRVLEAVDERLKGEFDEEMMKKLLLVGLKCAHPDGNERPSMRRVLQILNNEVEPSPVPKMKPTLSFSCGLSLDDIVSEDEEGDSIVYVVS
ncbi:Protein kinase-like domain superfamily [Arabidopsis thaliana x Arabidopsis arenosa]|uniref:non-specific serine/threonine protein kinase n=1 Tax=Arabidopsis thaliana x Arabidopsis arenosa TaxID=1240361 RepID=A0A8T1XJN5_9BRAS|nr:Protein kinase-like domain superfamily [Arabidopsis thaliana x Arabidopsis arenosa]